MPPGVELPIGLGLVEPRPTPPGCCAVVVAAAGGRPPAPAGRRCVWRRRAGRAPAGALAALRRRARRWLADASRRLAGAKGHEVVVRDRILELLPKEPLLDQNVEVRRVRVGEFSLEQ